MLSRQHNSCPHHYNMQVCNRLRRHPHHVCKCCCCTATYGCVLLWAEIVQKALSLLQLHGETLKLRNSIVLSLSQMMRLCLCVTAATLYVVYASRC